MVGRVSVSLEMLGPQSGPEICQETRLTQSAAARPARNPLAKQAVSRYPPVGASQSSISPAQNTPGMPLTINPSSSPSKRTPPALLIA